MINNIIKVVLLAVIVVLAYLVVESVMEPVRFKKETDHRSQAVIDNLIEIRSAQMTYKSIHGKYTRSFDTLIDFLKTGEIPVVKMVPDPTDTTFTKSIRDTIGYIPVADSLYRKKPGYQVENIRFIPFSDKKEFTLEAGTIEKGGVKVNVFEATAHYNTFLKGLNEQMVINIIATKEHIEKYPGLKVGSMVEASTDGNWE
ncbi:MAG: hypothetical protein JXA03_03670 [Bacteroidales bacterium]|nr:hypothetical protein [Bacteroidales bacterium]